MIQPHQIVETLKHCIQSPFQEARWLNTLSYLEYRGFRKMTKGLGTQDLQFQELLHLSEEVRHALWFKQKALQRGGDFFQSYFDETLLVPQATRTYLWNLTTLVSSLMNPEPSKREAYQGMTWGLERRALWLYPLYDQVLLESSRRSFSMRGILQEEQVHFSLLKEPPFLSLKLFEAGEEKLFQTWWRALSQEVLSHGL